MPGEVFLEGTTEDGVFHVRVPGGDPYRGFRRPEAVVEVNREAFRVAGVNRLRDGGTTTIVLEDGRMVTAHRRLREEPWDEFEGRRLISPR